MKFVEKFKILQLSTSHSGGAALSARRLNYSLNKIGLHSEFLTINRAEYNINANETAVFRGPLERFQSGTYSYFSKIISSETPFSLFSSNIINLHKLRSIAAGEKCIIHIHNWFNFISPNEIVRLIHLGIPVVVTLHDQRFFTGGCHVSYSCTRFTQKCGNCPLLPKYLSSIPTLNIQKNLKLFSKPISNLRFIAPSMWMQSLARSSSVLRHQEVRFIPNTLGDFQISENMSVGTSEYLEVGIASVNSGIYLKGGDIVQELENKIQKLNLKIKINYLSEYSRAKKENEFWNKLDVLLVPSRAENSPNVIHEAKSIGLPIIATDVGGINELINPVIDKLVSIQNLNVDFLVDLLMNFNKIKSKKVKSESIHIYRKYTENALADHIKLYKEMF